MIVPARARSAADQVDATSQLNLGNMYPNGDGVPQDNVQAYMWLALSIQYGDPTAQTNYFIIFEKPIFQWQWGRSEAVKARDLIAKQMTSIQITGTERLAREWKPKTN